MLKRALYFVDYFVAPVAAICLMALNLITFGISFEMAALYCLGVALWTLFEYVLHRLAHVWKPLKADHTFHHQKPKEISGPTSFSTLLVFAGLLVGLQWLIGLWAARAVLSGFMSGYAGYLYLHFGLHNWNIPGRWFANRKVLHDLHHKGKKGHFGVTTSFWDKVQKFISSL